MPPGTGKLENKKKQRPTLTPYFSAAVQTIKYSAPIEEYIATCHCNRTMHSHTSSIFLVIFSCSHMDIPGGTLVELSVEVVYGSGGSDLLGQILEPICDKKKRWALNCDNTVWLELAA